jgi:hypothetical protein
MCDRLYLCHFIEDNCIHNRKLSLLKQGFLIQKQSQILKCDLIPLKTNFCNKELLFSIKLVFKELAVIKGTMKFLFKDFHLHHLVIMQLTLKLVLYSSNVDLLFLKNSFQQENFLSLN